METAVQIAQIVFYLTAPAAAVFSAWSSWHNKRLLMKIQNKTDGMSERLEAAAFSRGVDQGNKETAVTGGPAIEHKEE